MCESASYAWSVGMLMWAACLTLFGLSGLLSNCAEPAHAAALQGELQFLVCVYGGSVTGSLSSTGFITIQRETRPHDPDQIMEECIYCQGPPHSPTQCPAIIQGAWSSPSQRQTLPIPIPPKPKEDTTTDKYPDHPIKPLLKRARQPKP